MDTAKFFAKLSYKESVMEAVSKIYQHMVNNYIALVDPEGKRSRKLQKGEFHIPLHNFSGPGTRMDLPEVESKDPYNDIDKCSKIHDISYVNIKDSGYSPDQIASLIHESDKQASECYDEYKEEYGYNLARKMMGLKSDADRVYSLMLDKNSVIYGGLVHNFTDNQLLEQRNPKYYTDLERQVIDLFRLNEDALVVPIGSFTFSIQKYPSDIDINETITVQSIEDIPSFVKDLQGLISNIQHFN